MEGGAAAVDVDRLIQQTSASLLEGMRAGPDGKGEEG